jgi:hypothetical protein
MKPSKTSSPRRSPSAARSPENTGWACAKKAWLRRQVGEHSHDLMREIKRAWDPRNLLNPGKIFD